MIVAVDRRPVSQQRLEGFTPATGLIAWICQTIQAPGALHNPDSPSTGCGAGVPLDTECFRKGRSRGAGPGRVFHVPRRLLAEGARRAVPCRVQTCARNIGRRPKEVAPGISACLSAAVNQKEFAAWSWEC